MSIVIYAVIFFECDVIVNIFNSEKNIALKQLGETGLKFYFTSTLFAGMNIITSIYFTSTESPLPAHIISLFRGFVFIIPVTFLMSFLFKMTGVYFSFPLSEFLVCIIGTVIYIKNADRPFKVCLHFYYNLIKTSSIERLGTFITPFSSS